VIGEDDLLCLLRKSIPRGILLSAMNSIESADDVASIRIMKNLIKIIGIYMRNTLNTEIKIRIAEKNRLKDVSVFYDKSLFTVFVRPDALLKDLILYYSCAGVDPIDALFYVFIHEYGHHQLNTMGVSPPEGISSRGYYAIYRKFEDYAVSKFLRGETYRRIEKKILVFNAMRSYESLAVRLIDDLFQWRIDYLARSLITKLMDAISTVALAKALSYMEIENMFELPRRILNLIGILSSKMRQIQKTKLGLIPKLAYDAWFSCYRTL